MSTKRTRLLISFLSQISKNAAAENKLNIFQNLLDSLSRRSLRCSPFNGHILHSVIVRFFTRTFLSSLLSYYPSSFGVYIVAVHPVVINDRGWCRRLWTEAEVAHQKPLPSMLDFRFAFPFFNPFDRNRLVCYRHLACLCCLVIDRCYSWSDTEIIGWTLVRNGWFHSAHSMDDWTN